MTHTPWPRVTRRAQRFNPPALLFIITSVFIAIGAINGQNNILFWIFGVSIAAVLVSGVAGGQALMALAARRDPPPMLRAGSIGTMTLRVANRSRWIPLLALRVEETGGFAPDELAPGVVESLGPRREARAMLCVRPTRRGVRRSAGLRVWTTYPFGLSRRVVEFDDPAEYLVLPEAAPLDAAARRRLLSVAEEGASRPRGAGTGDDLFGVREYVPGDSPRLIAWRASARSEDLLVRQFGQRVARHAWVGLVPSDHPDRREQEVRLAAAALEHLAARGVATGLLIDGRAGLLRPGAAPRHIREALERLAIFDDPERGLPAGQSPAVSARDALVLVGDPARAPAHWPRPSEVLVGETAPAWPARPRGVA